MEEIWKDITGYEGRYQVSNLGNIKSLPHSREIFSRGYKQVVNYKEKLLKPSMGPYKLVTLSKNKVKEYKLVHRLVAEAFIPNPKNLPYVNHKDENKHNNCVDNLEWCTAKYNTNYGNGAEMRKQTKRKLCGKCIDQYDISGNLIDILETAHSKEPEFMAKRIIECCKRRRKAYKGFIWVYHNEIPNLNLHPRAIYGVNVNDSTDIVYFDSVRDAECAGYVRCVYL